MWLWHVREAMCMKTCQRIVSYKDTSFRSSLNWSLIGFFNKLLNLNDLSFPHCTLEGLIKIYLHTQTWSVLFLTFH